MRVNKCPNSFLSFFLFMSLWQILLRYKSMNNLNIWDVINHSKSLKAPVNISAPRERQPSLVLHRIRHRHLLSTFFSLFSTFFHLRFLALGARLVAKLNQGHHLPTNDYLGERERGRGKKHFTDVVLNLLRSKDRLKDDGEGWHY